MWDIQDLFRRHSKELTRFLRRRVSSPEVAAELSQEAFLKLLTARPEEPVINGHAYLFRTAVNLAITHNRRERILAFVDDPDGAFANLADETPSPEHVLLSRQELAIIHQTLSEFPPIPRAVFILSRVEGQTYDEIGRTLNISSKAAFRHMVRVLVQLQLRLKRSQS